MFRDQIPAQYQYDIFVWTQDGTVCRYDLLNQKKTFSVQLKQKHIRTASAVSYQFQQEPYLIGVLNDDLITIIDKNCKQIGEIAVDTVMSQQNALNIVSISGAASTDVICGVNDGDIQLSKVYRGVPTQVVNVGQYLVVGYSLGYAYVRLIPQSFASFLSGQRQVKEKEQLLNLHSQPVIAIAPLDTGFVFVTEDGLMFNFALQDVPSAQKQLDDQKFTAINYDQLGKLEEEILSLKNQIYAVRVQTSTKKQQQERDFQQQMDVLINQTTEMTSQQQSEQSKLQTEHENKRILLMRQIANNQALFKTSKQALDQQYTKRQVFMHDEVQKLKSQLEAVRSELKTERASTQLALDKNLLLQTNQREEEINTLEQEAKLLRHKEDEMRLQHEAFYGEAENELYKEAQQLQTFYFQKKIDLQTEMEAAIEVHSAIKAEYKVLEKQLQSNQKQISEKELVMQERKQQIHDCKKEIEINCQEISQNEQTLQQREKRILDLDQKIRELNKISFILQFKIRELKRTIKPKELELEDLKQKLGEMNKELMQYKTNLQVLKTNKKDLGSKNLSLKQQIANVQAQEQQTIKKLQEVRIEINKMIVLIQDQDQKF